MKTTRDDGLVQGRTPDVSVIDKALWVSEPKAYAALEDPIQLAVEVSSTNWRDDYLYKLAEYEALGSWNSGLSIIWLLELRAISGLRKHRLCRFIRLQMGNISCNSFGVAIVLCPKHSQT